MQVQTQDGCLCVAHVHRAKGKASMESQRGAVTIELDARFPAAAAVCEAIKCALCYAHSTDRFITANCPLGWAADYSVGAHSPSCQSGLLWLGQP